MFDSLRRKLGKRRFSWHCRAILDTAPIQRRTADLRIVSMVRDDDVTMYVLAIKSLYRFLPGGDVVVIDDGTLTEKHRDVLRRHIEGLEFVHLSSIATGDCPKGGCWERLLHILELSSSSYVIQVDADVLTMGPIPEVVHAIRENRAFTLNGGPNQPIVDLETAASNVANGDTRHMQIRAERLLPRLPPGIGRHYVRGSAGFAGFSRGAATRRQAEAFSTEMRALLGPSWSEWGSEQIASNHIVCNSPGSQVLPWPDYCCYYPDVDAADSSLMHFIGTWRYDNGVYLSNSLVVIKDLRAHPGSSNLR